ncbi:MAG: rhomboid family intramembrane serine protease [Gemmatimonadaceae bacterium]|nr:rhomboid family intramembrane serine protease [Chitinophagaceae bacterium]
MKFEHREPIRDQPAHHWIFLAARVFEEYGWHIVSLSATSIVAVSGRNETTSLEAGSNEIILKIYRPGAWFDNQQNAKNKAEELIGRIRMIAADEPYDSAQHIEIYETAEKQRPGAMPMEDERPWPYPQKDFSTTPLLLWINIGVYIFLMVSGAGISEIKTAALMKYGAIHSESVYNGQWWRLVTGIFLHAGYLHLIGNMVGLYIAGIYLEPIIGPIKFALIYFLAGVLSSFICMPWLSGAVGVGASGAILGMFGAFLSLYTVRKSFSVIKPEYFINIGIYVSFIVISGFLNPQINNAAHIAGFVIGALLGLTWAAIYRKKNKPS